MTQHRPGWDEYFLDIAEAVAARGECVRSRVGAVIVRDRRIVATGYNGVAAGQPSCLDGLCPRALVKERHLPYTPGTPGYCIALHAEHNAVLDASRRGLDVAGSTIYLTREPCEQCQELLEGLLITPVWRRDPPAAGH
jgi:dCMP deaminase